MRGFEHLSLLVRFPESRGAVMGLLLWVGVFAAFYFLIIRPQKVKDKKVASMRDELAVGDKIVTIGGFIGTVTKVDEEDIMLEFGASRTKFPAKKWAVGSVIEKKNAKEEAPTEEQKLDD